MITPTAVDFDGDGDLDLVCGDEDGRVAFIEHTGAVADGMPQFLPPRYFRQYAADVKFGALATPYAVDWDGDGDEDLISGNTAGYIGFIENLGGSPVRWAPRFISPLVARSSASRPAPTVPSRVPPRRSGVTPSSVWPTGTATGCPTS